MTDNQSLVSLHAAVVDARNGYEEALKRADLPDLMAIFARVKALHEKAHAELHEALLTRGLAPDDSGSFMSTVHKTVIAARSALIGLDDKALPSFASGEERIVEDYDRAIEDNRYDSALVALLARQKHRLMAEIDVMKGTAGSAAHAA